MGARWTDDERRIVADIWKTPMSVKDQVHRLPGRTVDAVCREAEKLKLGHKALPARNPRLTVEQVKAAVRKVLAADKGMSREEISTKSSLSKDYIRPAIMEMLEAEEIHIVKYEGSYNTALFVLGKGVNAEKTTLSAEERRQRWEAKRRESAPTEAERDRAREARLDAKYRRRGCPWWPTADAVVGDAMRAMVMAGRDCL